IARRRGFFWGSFETYGGVSGFLDLGPYGLGLRRLLEDEWRRFFLRPHGFIEVSTPIITPSRVLEASGHVANFKDPMTECSNCKRRFRADQVVKDAAKLETEGLSLDQLAEVIREKNVVCPECGGTLGKPEYFHTMFKTTIGPYSEDVAYGRPEAAQGVFINFKRIMEILRERFPIGVAQIGTALRNEISPRQGPIRLREFTIMDFEFFFDPDEPDCPYLREVEDDLLPIVSVDLRSRGDLSEAVKVSVAHALRDGIVKTPWTAYFMALATRFLDSLGIPKSQQRFFEKLPKERAHYSLQTFDLEVQLDRWGWVEVAGFAYRTDFDLKSHMIASGTDMRVFKPYEKPIEKTRLVIKPDYARLRQLFGNEAGRIGGLLAAADPAKLDRVEGLVELDGVNVPHECYQTREEVFKEAGTKFLPHVIEPSFGVERLVYAALEYSLKMKEDRVILNLPPRLAPIQAAIFPLLGKDELPTKALEIFKDLSDGGFRVEYDDAGSIGRRYARADEAGIPIGITVDYDTLKDGTVTLRDRDTWKQVRRPASQLDRLVR
ncbi:MAG TPA: glycine--tRNA ligase, partial [Candidatus Binatus sp.]|nr:glycine--tRNA ligase [Candidatus Binatus sp.]